MFGSKRIGEVSMSGFDTARLTVERLLAEAKDGDTLEKAANAALALTKSKSSRVRRSEG